MSTAILHTIFICLFSSNVPCLLHLPLIHVPQSPATCHLSHFHSISDNGLLVHHIRCSSIFSLPVCDQNISLHSLSTKCHHPNDSGYGWNKAWYLVTQLAFLSFQLTSVFLSAYLNACGYSQAYFRKTVALSMSLDAINLLDAEKTRFQINLLQHTFVPTCQRYVLAKSWCHVLPQSPRQISIMLFKREGIATKKNVQSPSTAFGSECIRETCNWHSCHLHGASLEMSCEKSNFNGKV